ncbi:MAG: (d)CMP kinase [Thermodesulfobacteriota bacterium]|nr:(d)CMP kinase [Thermodesulfobacteriota bacterium]
MADDRIPKGLLITIDGPAGAGKSTVSKKLADILGYVYLDTGALYRALALAAQKNNLNPDKEEDLEKLCRKPAIALIYNGGKLTVILAGEDVSEEIRSPEISMLSSYISAKPMVRESLLEMQRDIGKRGSVVAEGRDMGTVVFPDADVKFYLDASPEERASRRHKELLQKGNNLDYEQVCKEMLKRDADDSSRAVAPLIPAPDAIFVDSTGKSIDEVIVFMLAKTEEKTALTACLRAAHKQV